MATVTRRFRRRGLVPIAIFFSIAALLVAYVCARLVPDAWPLAARAFGYASIAALVVGPIGALLLTGSRMGAALLPLGLFIFLGSFTAARDVAWLVAHLAGVADPAWFDTTSAVVFVLACLSFVIAVLRARSGPTVVDVDVPIAGLHPDLHGFTIAQLSDVHIGRTLQRSFMQDVVDAVNALEVDVVAITGDLVDGTVAELREHTAPLGELRSRHGTYFVTGNHDYYSGALPWIEELRGLGLRVLVNAHDVLAHGDGRVVVGGVTDHSMGASLPGHASDPHRAIAGAPADAVRVLLAHQPASAHEAARAGFHLQLSGHTHGGQFFPGTFFARFLFPFVSGLNKLDSLWLYVSHGTGFVGPPLRTTRVATEVTRLRLVAA